MSEQTTPSVITDSDSDELVTPFIGVPVRVFLRNNGVLTGTITHLKNHSILVESGSEGKSAWANLDYVISIARLRS